MCDKVGLNVLYVRVRLEINLSFLSLFLPLVCHWTLTEKILVFALPVTVSQVFDVETSEMLLEIRTNRLSMVQYCHASPTSNLLAIAFSNYTVEV